MVGARAAAVGVAGMAWTTPLGTSLADVWQLTTSGRAVILAQVSINRAATPLAGHGACQPNGVPVVFAGYDESTGGWRSNPDCFRLPDYLKDRNAKTLNGRRYGSYRFPPPFA